MKMKRNTYIVERETTTSLELTVYLGVRNAKKFDRGLASRQHNGLITWKGSYSRNKQGWTLFIKRCAELEALGIQRNYDGERNGC